MTSRLAAVAQLPLLAVITPLTSILLRASDSDGIAHRLLSMDPGTVLACRFFASSEPATCWLTDPCAIDAVVTGGARRLACSASTPAHSAGWLALISSGCRTCFEVDTAGVGGVVQLLQAPSSPLWVAARFAAASDAYQWLAGQPAQNLLEVLACTVAACELQVEPPRLLAPPDVRTIEQGVRGGRSSAAISGTPADAAVKRRRLATGSLSGGDVRSARSSKSHGRAQVVGSSGGGCGTGVSDATTSSSGFVRSGVGSSRCSTDFDVSTRLPSSPGSFPLGGVSSSGRRAADVGDRCLPGRGARDAPAARMAHGQPASGVKRARLCEEDGRLAVLNPAGVAHDGQGPVFTFGTIRNMMHKSLADWENQDVEEALRRDAALGAQSREADKDGGAGEFCKPVVVASRQAGGSGGRLTTPAAVGPDARHAGALAPRLDLRPDDSREPPTGELTRMAADKSWTFAFGRLHERARSTFVSGAPGVGKSSFLRGFAGFLRSRLTRVGAVVIVAPTGSAAKTAKGVTFHSFFGLVKQYKMELADPVAEASRMLGLERWKPIKRRLAKVEVLLLDEVSMVSADNLDVMYELLRQSRGRHAPPFTVYAFGDFLQLSPPLGEMAFTARCWRSVFGASFVELTRVHRQGQPDFVAALHDARLGKFTTAVQTLVRECTVSDEQYNTLESTVLHLMPRHVDVTAHNDTCLARLCPGQRPADFIADDGVKLDPNRQCTGLEPDLSTVPSHSRDAALLECVAPRVVQHCRHARVMLITNHLLGLGLFHGSIGRVVDYDPADGAPVVRFENHEVVSGTRAGVHGVRDAGADWIEVLCPPVDFEARVFSRPGVLAVRRQVPFVLGWAITVHRSQSLTLSEAVIDVGEAFGAGMVLAAMSRVADKRRMYVRSFSGSRLLADRAALQFYTESPRL